MKITREQLLKIAQQELQTVMQEIKFKPKKTSKHMKGLDMGSADNPCKKPGGGDYGVGKRLFDPHDMSRPNPDEWECNTDIEDKLHDAISSFIAFNSPAKILGRIGEFILKYFKDKSDDSLPIHKFAVDKPLYRGSARKFNDYGFKFLEQVQWDQGVEHSKAITRFPFNGVYQLRRPVSSFSDSFESAAGFMQTNSDKDCIFMYETSGVTETDNGGFFLDLDGMYRLQNNPEYSMSADGKIRFNDVSGFWHENEVLLIGNGNGDSIKVDYVYINTQHLNKNMNKLKQLNPELAERIRSEIGYPKAYLNNIRAQFKREVGYLKRVMQVTLPNLKKNLDNPEKPGLYKNLLKRIKGRLNFYMGVESVFAYMNMQKQYQEFMKGMGDLYKELQSLKGSPPEWTSGQFAQTPTTGGAFPGATKK